MKTRMLLVLGTMSLGAGPLLSAPMAQAHDCCQGHHRCPMADSTAAQQGGPGKGPMYDPDTVTTMRGTVGVVDVVPARGGRMGGMHVSLDSEGKTMDVHLGPTWFLQGQGLELAKGDSIEVTGSVIDSEGNTFLIARQLKKGEKVVTLRDEHGVPAWSGGRRP